VNTGMEKLGTYN